MDKFLSGIIIALLQLMVGFTFSVATAYIGITLLDKLTGGGKKWDMIKKGNVAVGILYAASVFALIYMMEPSITATVISLNTAIAQGMMLIFIAHLTVLAIALIIAVLSICILLHIMDTMSFDVEEMKEIQKGNVAIALISGSVLVAVSLVVRTAIVYLVNALTFVGI